MSKPQDKKPREHIWGPSPYGHGNQACVICFCTDLEAKAIGLDECPGPYVQDEGIATRH